MENRTDLSFSEITTTTLALKLQTRFATDDVNSNETDKDDDSNKY